MTLQPSNELSPTASGALIGGGVGSAVGLLSTLFKKDRSIKDFVKRTLIGGGVGAAVGAGSGGLARSDTPTPPPASESPKSKLSGRSAALAGLFPVIGPAAYGAAQSEGSQRISNALKLGGSSLVGGLPGGIAAQLAAGSKHPELNLPAMLLAMAGSSYGSRLMTDHINKQAASFMDVISNGASAIGNQLQQGAGGLRDRVGNLQIRPLDPMGGATAGGLGGAAIGGLGGLLKAILDGEEDGIMGTLRKTLGGAAIGGATGAAMGGGYSALRRNHLLSQVPEKHYGKIREIMSSYTTPLKAETNRIMGGDPNRYARDINSINARASISHLAAPSLVRHLEQRATNTRA